MTQWMDVQESKDYTKVLDQGFVGLVDVMGDDSAIIQAARTSYGKGTKSVSEDRALIRYLLRHMHTSVFEMVEFKFHIKLPIFVMRQHVRHRTANLNEYSGRYSVMTDEFYIPELNRMQAQSTANKQGSGSLLQGEDLTRAHDIIKQMSSQAYENYLTLVNEPKDPNREGLSRELARIILPVNNYTECYWKIDLKNLFHYIKLRADHHAQWEIQEFAKALAAFVKARCPVAFEAFEDYWEQSATLSRMDHDLLQAIIRMSNHMGVGFSSAYQWLQMPEGGREAVRLKYGMSKRELSEFEAKWQLTVN